MALAAALRKAVGWSSGAVKRRPITVVICGLACIGMLAAAWSVYGSGYALYGCAMDGDLRGAECILRLGGRTSFADADGRTALHVAAWGHRSEIVSLLLKWGLDPNQRTVASGRERDGSAGSGCTPLHLAARGGYTEIVEMLLDHGAEIDALGGEYSAKTTPLANAVARDHIEVVKLLLDRGASVTTRGSEGHSAIRIGRLRRNPEVLPLLEAAAGGTDATRQPSNLP